jgi:uncharacterized SAM-binding protein YcdF (DUF218 family)
MRISEALGRKFIGLIGRFSRGVLLTSGALLLAVLFTPVVPWTAQLLATPWTGVNRGVLIILSGATLTYDEASPRSIIGLNTYWRTIHAIYVWRAGHFSNILLAGAGSAETVKPLLIANGIPEGAIILENRSTSTHENAIFSKPILVGLSGPYVLLTSDYHMFRASRCFAHEDITVETLPAPDMLKRCNARMQRWDLFCQLIGEVTAIVYYRARGWI